MKCYRNASEFHFHSAKFEPICLSQIKITYKTSLNFFFIEKRKDMLFIFTQSGMCCGFGGSILCVGISCCFVFTAAMLTDPGVVHELVKEEEIRTRQLVHKYSEKMKQFGVRTLNNRCYRCLTRN